MKFLGKLHTILSKSYFAAKIAQKIKNQADLVIRQRYSSNSCDFNLNGEQMLLDQIAPHCFYFIDVGANVGNWTEKLFKKAPVGCQGVLFEPGAVAFEHLKEKFSPNIAIKLFNMGLSDNNGEMPFYEQPNSGEMSSFCKIYTESFSKQVSSERNVCVSTLDFAMEKIGWCKVDILKIDTEGFDLKVIKGAAALLETKSIGVLQFEYNEPWKNNNCTLVETYEFLQSFGYSVYALRRDGLYSYDVKLFGDYYSYSNYVAISPEYISIVQPLVKGKI